MTALDDEVAKLARGQHAAFTRRQVALIGGSRKALRHREDSGEWELVIGDVLRFPGAPHTWQQEMMIATLAGGPEASAAQLSAGALLQFPGFREGPVETLRLRGSDHDTIVGRLHETRVLPPHHLTIVEGITTTNAARTVFDLAGRIHPDRLDRLVDFVDRRYHALPALRAMLPELAERGRRGIRIMRALLDARGEGYVATESEAEALAVQILREYGVKEGIRQVNLGSDEKWIGRVDWLYREERLILELDSRLAHGGEVATLEDARRRAEYAAIGLRVLPVHYLDMKANPAWFARLVRQALASGGGFGPPGGQIHRQNESGGQPEAAAG